LSGNCIFAEVKEVKMKLFFRNRLTYLSVIFLLLAGCKTIELENGVIPAEYLDQAQRFVGQYEGHFNGFKGVLTVSMKQNQPSIQWKDRRGNDLLAPKCKSQVGLAKSIYTETNNQQTIVREITFSFDPGQCIEVEGRQLTIKFFPHGDRHRIVATILNKMDQGQECFYGNDTPGIYPPGGINIPPDPGLGYNCRIVYKPTYFYGEME
jgi:hypothetical protein